MALGRGLASLIPGRRSDEDLEDEYEDIESIENVEDYDDEPDEVDASDEEVDSVGIPVEEEVEDEGDVEISDEDDAEVTAEESDEPEVEDVEEVQAETDEEVEDLATELEAAQRELENSIDDFSQLEGEPEIPIPPKPAVTPLELDPENDADLYEIAEKAAQETKMPEKVTASVAQVVVKKAVPSKSETEDVVGDTEKIERQKLAKRRMATASEPESMELHGDMWDQHEDQVQHIAIGDIQLNPLQPRRQFDQEELEELKSSIDQHGILQPLVVARLADNTYQLIAGERRLRAAKELSWTKVPCVVRREVSGDQTRLVYALIENLQRENLNPIELAKAYQTLNKDYGLSHEEIGERMGKSRVSITNDMRVLQLPAEIQRGLMDGKITPGHARAILMIPDEEKQLKFYKHIIDEGITVRKAETRARRIQRTLGVDDPMRKKTFRRHPLAQKYTARLEDRYTANVNVQFKEEKNRFDILFKAYNMTEFEELVGKLLGTAELNDDQDDDVVEE